MSCKHGNWSGACDECDEVDAIYARHAAEITRLTEENSHQEESIKLCDKRIDQLTTERDRLRGALNRLVTERRAGLASGEAWDVARAALAPKEGETE